MAAIETHELAREFEGGIKAVDGVDLEVAAGEIYGFLGPNGAGKTTTVRMLTTLLRPTGGRAVGRRATTSPRTPERSGGRSASPCRRRRWIPLMTGRELLELQATLHGISKKEGRNKGRWLLDRVGLTLAADRRIGTYSGGMRRRLDLAAALMHTPEVLFLDEPTTGLDPVSRKAIWEEVRKLNEEGTTVFLTTQYLEEADQLADRVGIISGGKLVAEGTPGALKAEVGRPHLELSLVEQEGKESRAEDRPGPLRAPTPRQGRDADGGAGARHLRGRPDRRSAQPGGPRRRVARPRPAHARRRLRPEDRPAPRGRVRGHG